MKNSNLLFHLRDHNKDLLLHFNEKKPGPNFHFPIFTEILRTCKVTKKLVNQRNGKVSSFEQKKVTTVYLRFEVLSCLLLLLLLFFFFFFFFFSKLLSFDRGKATAG